MKLFAIDEGAAVRITWLLAAFTIVGVGVGLVWWPASQRTDELRARAREMYEEANRFDAEIHQAARLREIKARVLRDVSKLAGQSSRSAATATSLALLNDEARRFSIQIRSITPQPGSASGLPSPPPRGRKNLDGYDIAIVVHGGFRDIVSFVADLPRHNVLVSLNDVTMTLDGKATMRPILNATVNATVYRLNSPG